MCISYLELTSTVKATTQAEPVLNAEGYAICPDCGSHVNCGTIGLANLEKCHRGKKVCKAVQEKRDKAKKLTELYSAFWNQKLPLSHRQSVASYLPKTTNSHCSQSWTPAPAFPPLACLCLNNLRVLNRFTCPFQGPFSAISSNICRIWSKAYQRASPKLWNLIDWQCLEYHQWNMMI